MTRAPLAGVMTDSGATLSYAELDRRSIQFANLLRARGLTPGDRVAILLENRLAWFVAMWGVRRAEMLFVPVNWHLQPAEIRYVVDNSDARAIVTSAALAGVAAAAIGGLAAVTTRLSIGGGDGFEDFATAIAAHSATAPADERDGGSMPYSSGTTGQPKGILRALTGDPFGTPNSLERLATDLYGFGADTVYLTPAPLYHSSPVGFTGAVLNTGGTNLVMPRFDAEAALAAIERHRVTHVQFVPTHLVRLLRLPDAVKARHDLSSLQVVIHAAAPCAPEVKRAAIDWFGPIVHEYYAGSERCGMTAIDTPGWLAHPGSVGRSRTSPLHILDPDSGAELPPGEIGQVYFEKPVPFAYHKDEAKTAATYSPQGWGTHGDLGHVDADGWLYLADRRADLILSGGVNIYPQEIEDALARHPAVADAGVIGVPDAEYGQTVKAFVQLLPDATATEAELIAFVRCELAGFKAPRAIAFVVDLPRLPNGKLLRRRLKEEESCPS